jgi:prepilin-type N-terminal cleavage/methylation domain-containing protein
MIVMAGIGRKGFSFVEMLITLTVISLLLGLAAHEFSKWVARYTIESQVQELYSKLQSTRAQAMFRNTAHFLVLDRGGYSIVADTYPSAFGNGELDVQDSVISPFKAFTYNADRGSVVKFDNRGLAPLNNARTVCFVSEVNPSFDCLIIHRARINMGKIRKQTDPCKAENCMAK